MSNQGTKSSTAVILTIISVLAAIAALVFGILLTFNMLTAETVVSAAGSSVPASLTIYDAPNLSRAARDTKITVNGNNVFVYDTPVNNSHTWVEGGDPPMSYTPMTYFDFSGQVTLDIELPDAETLTDVIVRPLSANITPKVEGNKISFDIANPGQYTVEYNGSIERAIHIFANPQETDIPDKNDPNVIFIEPGFWNIDTITLEDDQTLYISGGAVVYGTIRANGAKNVTVRGRGIMDGSLNASWTHGIPARAPVDFVNCDGITMEGIIFVNSNAWVVNSLSSKNAHFNNLKIISARQNGDGITLQSCENYLVTNSFVRSWDDSLVVKNYEGNTNNITFDNIQVWTDLAQSCEIGYETNKGNRVNPIMSNITYKNITVLHNFHKPVISIHNSDNALISGVNFLNITVEDAQMGEGDAGTNSQLIDFAIVSSSWSQTNTRGNIRNVVIENVNVLSGKKPANRIIGFGPGNTVEDIKIKDLTILGERITDLEQGGFSVNEFTENIVIE